MALRALVVVDLVLRLAVLGSVLPESETGNDETGVQGSTLMRSARSPQSLIQESMSSNEIAQMASKVPRHLRHWAHTHPRLAAMWLMVKRKQRRRVQSMMVNGNDDAPGGLDGSMMQSSQDVQVSPSVWPRWHRMWARQHPRLAQLWAMRQCKLVRRPWCANVVPKRRKFIQEQEPQSASEGNLTKDEATITDMKVKLQDQNDMIKSLMTAIGIKNAIAHHAGSAAEAEESDTPASANGGSSPATTAAVAASGAASIVAKPGARHKMVARTTTPVPDSEAAGEADSTTSDQKRPTAPHKKAFSTTTVPAAMRDSAGAPARTTSDPTASSKHGSSTDISGASNNVTNKTAHHKSTASVTTTPFVTPYPPDAHGLSDVSDSSIRWRLGTPPPPELQQSWSAAASEATVSGASAQTPAPPPAAAAAAATTPPPASAAATTPPPGAAATPAPVMYKTPDQETYCAEDWKGCYYIDVDMGDWVQGDIALTPETCATLEVKQVQGMPVKKVWCDPNLQSKPEATTSTSTRTEFSYTTKAAVVVATTTTTSTTTIAWWEAQIIQVSGAAAAEGNGEYIMYDMYHQVPRYVRRDGKMWIVLCGSTLSTEIYTSKGNVTCINCQRNHGVFSYVITPFPTGKRNVNDADVTCKQNANTFGVQDKGVNHPYVFMAGTGLLTWWRMNKQGKVIGRDTTIKMTVVKEWQLQGFEVHPYFRWKAGCNSPDKFDRWHLHETCSPNSAAPYPVLNSYKPDVVLRSVFEATAACNSYGKRCIGFDCKYEGPATQCILHSCSKANAPCTGCLKWEDQNEYNSMCMEGKTQKDVPANCASDASNCMKAIGCIKTVQTCASDGYELVDDWAFVTFYKAPVR